jgi:NADH-quinone oxidoreductase subunit K
MQNSTGILASGVGPTEFLVLSALIFVIGVVGVLTRRGVITMLMSIELMLNAANLAFVTFARTLPDATGAVGQVDGQIVVFLVMAVAAAEAAVGLGIVYALFRLRGSTDADLANLMKW